MSVQVDLARKSLQRSFEGARRIGEIFIRMSEDAQRAMERSGGGRDGGRFDEQDGEDRGGETGQRERGERGGHASSIAVRARRSGRHASLARLVTERAGLRVRPFSASGKKLNPGRFCVRQFPTPRLARLRGRYAREPVTRSW